jgi:hypothetical protein
MHNITVHRIFEIHVHISHPYEKKKSPHTYKCDFQVIEVPDADKIKILLKN